MEILWRYLERYPACAVCDTCVDTVWFSFCFLYNGNFINLIVMSLALRPAIGVAVRGCVWLGVARCVCIYKELGVWLCVK